MKLGKYISLLIALGSVANGFAAQRALLTNGFAITCDHSERVQDVTRLYLAAGSENFVDVPTAGIDHFEDHVAAESLVPSALEATDVHHSATTTASIPQAVRSASTRHAIDSDFINSVIAAESGFHPQAVSRKGARGLMQLMPGTAQTLGVQNSFDPGENVDAGAHYLSNLLYRYHGDAVKALAAYNAGPLAVDKYHGVPPYHETRAYVARIIRDYNRKKLVAQRQNQPSVSHHKAQLHKSVAAATRTPAETPASVALSGGN